MALSVSASPTTQEIGQAYPNAATLLFDRLETASPAPDAVVLAWGVLRIVSRARWDLVMPLHLAWSFVKIESETNALTVFAVVHLETEIGRLLPVEALTQAWRLASHVEFSCAGAPERRSWQWHGCGVHGSSEDIQSCALKEDQRGKVVCSWLASRTFQSDPTSM